jgi:hypothetical protein
LFSEIYRSKWFDLTRFVIFAVVVAVVAAAAADDVAAAVAAVVAAVIAAVVAAVVAAVIADTAGMADRTSAADTIFAIQNVQKPIKIVRIFKWPYLGRFKS